MLSEKPHLILDRDRALKDAEKILGKHLFALRDIVNYGSNLVVRAYISSDQGMAALMTCGVLLKQVVTMLDSSEVLLSAGNALTAYAPARAAFEASVFLEWLLVSDTDHKANVYYIATIRRQREWARRVIKGTEEERAFRMFGEEVAYDLHAGHPTLEAEAARQVAEIDRVLGQQAFDQINRKYTALRKTKRHDPQWYAVAGKPSLRSIAKELGRMSEYELLYSAGSRVIHSASYKDHLLLKSPNATFKPIRSLEEVNTLLTALFVTAISTYRRVIRFYRIGEAEAFERKYREAWRPYVQSVPGVTIKWEK